MQTTKAYCPNCDWIGEEDDIFCQQCGSKMEHGRRKVQAVAPTFPELSKPSSERATSSVDVNDEYDVDPTLGFVLTSIGIGVIVIIGMASISAVLIFGAASDFTFFLVVGLIGIPFIGISAISENYRKTFRRKLTKTRTQKCGKKNQVEITK